MWQSVQNLWWLLSQRVAFSHSGLLRAAAALAVLVVAGPFEPQLNQLGLSLVALAVVASFTVMFWLNIKSIPWSELSSISNGQAFAIVFLTVIPFLATILFAPFDYWVQHGVSMLYLARAAYVFGCSLTGEDGLRDCRFEFSNWPVGKVNAARWLALFCFAQCIANEVFLNVFSSKAWIVAFAAAPLLFHYLYNLTVIATHPHEDEDGR